MEKLIIKGNLNNNNNQNQSNINHILSSPLENRSYNYSDKNNIKNEGNIIVLNNIFETKKRDLEYNRNSINSIVNGPYKKQKNFNNDNGKEILYSEIKQLNYIPQYTSASYCNSTLLCNQQQNSTYPLLSYNNNNYFNNQDSKSLIPVYFNFNSNNNNSNNNNNDNNYDLLSSSSSSTSSPLQSIVSLSNINNCKNEIKSNNINDLINSQDKEVLIPNNNELLEEKENTIIQLNQKLKLIENENKEKLKLKEKEYKSKIKLMKKESEKEKTELQNEKGKLLTDMIMKNSEISIMNENIENLKINFKEQQLQLQIELDVKKSDLKSITEELLLMSSHSKKSINLSNNKLKNVNEEFEKEKKLNDDLKIENQNLMQLINKNKEQFLDRVSQFEDELLSKEIEINCFKSENDKLVNDNNIIQLENKSLLKLVDDYNLKNEELTKQQNELNNKYSYISQINVSQVKEIKKLSDQLSVKEKESVKQQNEINNKYLSMCQVNASQIEEIKKLSDQLLLIKEKEKIQYDKLKQQNQEVQLKNKSLLKQVEDYNLVKLNNEELIKQQNELNNKYSSVCQVNTSQVEEIKKLSNQLSVIEKQQIQYNKLKIQNQEVKLENKSLLKQVEDYNVVKLKNEELINQQTELNKKYLSMCQINVLQVEEVKKLSNQLSDKEKEQFYYQKLKLQNQEMSYKYKNLDQQMKLQIELNDDEKVKLSNQIQLKENEIISKSLQNLKLLEQVDNLSKLFKEKEKQIIELGNNLESGKEDYKNKIKEVQNKLEAQNNLIVGEYENIIKILEKEIKELEELLIKKDKETNENASLIQELSTLKSELTLKNQKLLKVESFINQIRGDIKDLKMGNIESRLTEVIDMSEFIAKNSEFEKSLLQDKIIKLVTLLSKQLEFIESIYIDNEQLRSRSIQFTLNMYRLDSRQINTEKKDIQALSQKIQLKQQEMVKQSLNLLNENQNTNENIIFTDNLDTVDKLYKKINNQFYYFCLFSCRFVDKSNFNIIKEEFIKFMILAVMDYKFGDPKQQLKLYIPFMIQVLLDELKQTPTIYNIFCSLLQFKFEQNYNDEDLNLKNERFQRTLTQYKKYFTDKEPNQLIWNLNSG